MRFCSTSGILSESLTLIGQETSTSPICLGYSGWPWSRIVIPPEFKDEAVKQVLERGYTITEVRLVAESTNKQRQ